MLQGSDYSNQPVFSLNEHDKEGSMNNPTDDQPEDGIAQLQGLLDMLQTACKARTGATRAR